MEVNITKCLGEMREQKRVRSTFELQQSYKLRRQKDLST